MPANVPIDLTALAARPLPPGAKGIPPRWWGRTPAHVTADTPRLWDEGVPGPVCVLRAEALAHNLAAMAAWCRAHGVELAPHGKTHMSPQLAARQLEAGACGITVATVAQAGLYRAFGVRDFILANEVVDESGLRWLATELGADPELRVTCWVDSVRGVELMDGALAGAARPLEVCVEIGIAGGRTGVRSIDDAEQVARAVVASSRLRLAGVAGYEAARGQDVTPGALAVVAGHLADLRAAVLRLAPLVETPEVLVSAGGSSYFDVVAQTLSDWPAALQVRTVLRSGCYLTHDHGLYARTSPLTRDGRAGLRPALEVYAQVVSRPEPDLTIVSMGRRDVSFDQGLPVALDHPGTTVTALNDQHAFLRTGTADMGVGTWLRFGISHPCTTFDKWRVLPVLNDEDRVVDLVQTFF